MKKFNLKKPKKAWIGAVVQAGKMIGDTATSWADGKKEAEMQKFAETGRLDTNKVAGAEATALATEINPLKKIQRVSENKDLTTAEKWSAGLGAFGGIGGGVVNLFNKDLSAKEKLQSFIPFAGGKVVLKKAAERAQKRETTKRMAEEDTRRKTANAQAIDEQRNIVKTAFRRGGVVKAAWGTPGQPTPSPFGGASLGMNSGISGPNSFINSKGSVGVNNSFSVNGKKTPVAPATAGGGKVALGKGAEGGSKLGDAVGAIGTALGSSDTSYKPSYGFDVRKRAKMMPKGGSVGNDSPLIEIQKGEVMWSPRTGDVSTAKQLAHIKGIPERTHKQSGYDPQQSKYVTGIQIPKPNAGTVIYGELKNPTTGNKFQTDAQKLAKQYQQAANAARDPRLDRLAKRTAKLNAMTTQQQLSRLAEVQSAVMPAKHKAKFAKGGTVPRVEPELASRWAWKEYHKDYVELPKDRKTKQVKKKVYAKGGIVPQYQWGGIVPRFEKGDDGDYTPSKWSLQDYDDTIAKWNGGASGELTKLFQAVGVHLKKKNGGKTPSDKEIIAHIKKLGESKHTTNSKSTSKSVKPIGATGVSSNTPQKSPIPVKVLKSLAPENKDNGDNEGYKAKDSGYKATESGDGKGTKKVAPKTETEKLSEQFKTPWYSKAAAVVGGLAPGAINLITGLRHKAKVYKADDYRNRELGNAISQIERAKLNIDPELAEIRGNAGQNAMLAQAVSGGSVNTYATALRGIQRTADKARYEAYARKHNHDAGINREVANLRVTEGQRMAGIRQQVDMQNEAERAARINMINEGIGQLGQGVADIGNYFAKEKYNSSLLALGDKHGVIPTSWRTGGRIKRNNRK